MTLKPIMLGVLVVVPFGVHLCMGLVDEFGAADRWGDIPLVGGAIFLAAFAPTIVEYHQLFGPARTAMVFGTGWAISNEWARIWQLALEDSVIPRPSAISPARERYHYLADDAPRRGPDQQQDQQPQSQSKLQR